MTFIFPRSSGSAESIDNNDSDLVGKFTIELPDTGDWKCAVNDLIDDVGVFKLSYLETLVRIADRRASTLREIKA